MNKKKIIAAAAVGTAVVAAFLIWKPKDVSVETISKTVFDTKDKTEQLIDSLYGSAWGTISQEERQKITDVGGAPVYGEITYESSAIVLNELNLNKNDIFYDLGSGLGKFVIQTHLTTPAKKAVGIELSPTRLKRAKKALVKLKTLGKVRKGQEIDFLYGDIAKANVSDATVVFMCSTCFSEELMTQIINNLAKQRKGKSLKLISLKELPKNPHFKHEKEIKLHMSWSPKYGSMVRFYELKKPGEL
ncbi:hypothetical protein ACFLY6_02865 [Candidatus Dependentiae bacterium]